MRGMPEAMGKMLRAMSPVLEEMQAAHSLREMQAAHYLQPVT